MANTTLTQFPAGQPQYKINFDYLARAFVVVTLIDSANPAKNKVLTVTNDYRFLNPTTIEILASQTGFDIIQIHRFTSTDLMVEFRDGSVLTANDLTNSELQAIHIAEEGRDQSTGLAKQYADQSVAASQEAQRILDEVIALGAYGFNIKGSFELGGTVSLPNDLLQLGANENISHWRWEGALPKTVPAGSTPKSTGGIGKGKWVDITDASTRAYSDKTFVRKPVVPANGSFQLGGTAVSKASALYDSTTAMYYTPKTGQLTVPAGSTPGSDWVCIGSMTFTPMGDVRNFGAIATVDSAAVGATNKTAISLGLKFSEFMKDSLEFPDGLTFNTDYITARDLTFADLTGTGHIRARSGRTGATDYSGGALLTFIRCSNVTVRGPLFDGNRDGSPLYTGFAHGIQCTTADGDFRSVTTRLNKNIKILAPTKFQNLGSFRNGNDKFGDGIYLFGVEKFAVQGVEFKDVGRWGVAMSDVNDGDISKCLCVNTMASSVALGFVNIETESTDGVNGTSAYNIDVHDNRMIGYGQILVGAGNNTENKMGRDHFVRNIKVYRNHLTVPADATHYSPDYETNLVYIGLAPFCHDFEPTRPVINEQVYFYDNIVENLKTTNKSIGLGINAQGKGYGSSVFNIVQDIFFRDNTSVGFLKPFHGAGESSSEGYTFRHIVTASNTLRSRDDAQSIGLRLAATQLVDCEVSENFVSGTSLRAISIEDARDLGAVDSRVIVRANIMRAKAGTNMFAYCYRMALQLNIVEGDALAIYSNITVIEKDHGNTWNTIKRTLPATGALSHSSQVVFPNIDLGGQVRYGYSLRVCPPFNMGGLQVTGNVTSMGLGEVIFSNLSGSSVGRSSDDYTLIVEKS